MGKCRICKREDNLIANSIELCLGCIRNNIKEIEEEIIRIHFPSRKEYNLEVSVPFDKDGILCQRCGNNCRIRESKKGYCGLRENKKGKLIGPNSEKANLSFYFDPLPTNCVAEWVCAGCSHYGFPEFSYNNGPEYGYYNLAIFFQGCSFNCLFCQNWHFRLGLRKPNWVKIDDILKKINSRTSCICFFGGDPGPQIDFAINLSSQVLKEKSSKFLRICWETNGNLSSVYLDEMINLSISSGGCIKFDIKAYNQNLHRILTGRDNKRTLENFSYMAKFIKKRPQLPLLIASTLLIPGYIDEEEVYQIAHYIAKLDKNIPYCLLAFYPNFYLSDLPITTKQQAYACLNSARKAGLKNIRLGNIHLLI